MKCEGCLFYRPFLSRRPGEGSCHRNPPLPESAHTASGWPETTADGWCGEYRAASAIVTSHVHINNTGAGDDQDEGLSLYVHGAAAHLAGSDVEVTIRRINT